MTRSIKKKRRRLERIQACIHGPWFMMPEHFNGLVNAIEERDLSQVDALFGSGGSDASAARIVNGVAVIPVSGVLRDSASDWMVRYGFASSYQAIEKEVRRSLGSEQVKSVILVFDTPGGSAIGAKRCADAIHELRGKKKIIAYTQTTMGSAGYYLAAACDRIESTSDALVGSIGTIMNHFDQSKMLEDYGIKATVITNSRSPKKGHGNSYEALSEDAKKTLNAFIDSYGEGFISDVARYRKISADQVVGEYGQGDSFRGDIAKSKGMVDKVVKNLNETLSSVAGTDASAVSVTEDDDDSPALTGSIQLELNKDMKYGKKIRSQLLAAGLISDANCEDAICETAILAFFAAIGKESPSDHAEIGKLIENHKPKADTSEGDDDEDEPEDNDEDDDEEDPSSVDKKVKRIKNQGEQQEAKLEDFRSSAKLFNAGIGSDEITDTMVCDAVLAGMTIQEATKAWSKTLAEKEPGMSKQIGKVTENRDKFAGDAVEALLHNTLPVDSRPDDYQLSEAASALVRKPLWAIAGQAMQLAGEPVDLDGDHASIAAKAMSVAGIDRHEFYSQHEDRRYVDAAGPVNRPGDFPSILSALANKFLDFIELDEDYSYPLVSAQLPGGLNDFKPGLMMNRSVPEEMDEVLDSGTFKEIGLQEEVLSYIQMRRFGNSFAWTPVLIANDDLNAFAEGMIGLREAWERTQNRLVVGRFTSTETLLDGSALLANRADVAGATNNNLRTGGGAPSDAEWGEMEILRSDIGGVDTNVRVRGALNVCFTPTGARHQEARRTFMPLNNLEPKSAATTANVGLYRGDVAVIAESELRENSPTSWYGLRNPTNIRTATVVRAYFNGFGQRGRRERWYDPTTKSTYISLEGRIACAVKNWRNIIGNQA